MEFDREAFTKIREEKLKWLSEQGGNLNLAWEVTKLIEETNAALYFTCLNKYLNTGEIDVSLYKQVINHLHVEMSVVNRILTEYEIEKKEGDKNGN